MTRTELDKLRDLRDAVLTECFKRAYVDLTRWRCLTCGIIAKSIETIPHLENCPVKLALECIPDGQTQIIDAGYNYRWSIVVVEKTETNGRH